MRWNYRTSFYSFAQVNLLPSELPVRTYCSLTWFASAGIEPRTISQEVIFVMLHQNAYEFNRCKMWNILKIAIVTQYLCTISLPESATKSWRQHDFRVTTVWNVMRSEWWWNMACYAKFLEVWFGGTSCRVAYSTTTVSTKITKINPK